ncbi:transglycosylase family protein [Streptomyces sp. enrichment culture]|uniref:transglycosylase family protein n=1 Tax=Streptomyces sp. enrichment culture TaxID=1795815 RepID=UPI003F54CA26
MLSGNGRHRRPRQAPAFVVAAGVTGSAIALPLLAAGSASAADGKTWDRIAECETGGSWSENSGNGYYGGLQMSQEKWEKYGGLEYAASADLASRRQQIEIADKALAAEGVGDWATCGLIAGLQSDSPDGAAGQGETGTGGTDLPNSLGLGGSSTPPATPETDAPSASASATPSQTPGGQGATDAPAGSEASGEPSAESSASPSASPSAKGEEKGKADTSDAPSAAAPSTEGTGRHRGAPAQEEVAAGDQGAAPAAPDAGAARGVMDATAGVSAVVGLWSLADTPAPSATPTGPTTAPETSPSAQGAGLSAWNQ